MIVLLLERWHACCLGIRKSFGGLTPVVMIVFGGAMLAGTIRDLETENIPANDVRRVLSEAATWEEWWRKNRISVPRIKK